MRATKCSRAIKYSPLFNPSRNCSTKKEIVINASSLLKKIPKVVAGHSKSAISEIGEEMTSAQCTLNSSSVSTCKDLLKSPFKVINQYKEYKEKYPNYVILMQVGDFYEAFGSIALIVAESLDIGLCQESKFMTEMTGFPTKSLDCNLEKLLKCGHSVVICDQFLTNGTINRQISRIVTAGTVTEENLLDGKQNNFIASLHFSDTKDRISICWIDVSTGYHRIETIKPCTIFDELSRISPKEILIDKRNVSKEILFFSQRNSILITEQIFVADINNNDNVFKYDKDFSLEEAIAGQTLIKYIHSTQLNCKPYIEEPQRFNLFMKIDISAIKSLELLKNLSSQTRINSLIHCIDHTCTAAGSRLFSQHLQNPLIDIDRINERLDQVSFFIKNPDELSGLQTILSNCKDLERCFQRISLDKATGGPRDMQTIQSTLSNALHLAQKIFEKFGKESTRVYNPFNREQCLNLINHLSKAIVDAPPSRPSDGNCIKSGYNEDLDNLRDDRDTIEGKREKLLDHYRNNTKKKTMKIISRKNQGWLLEVTKNDGRITQDGFRLESQLEGKFRYRTEQLDNLYRQYFSSGDAALAKECEVYQNLRSLILENQNCIINAAKSLAELDLMIGKAVLAHKHNHSRPILKSSPRNFEIIDGRHPVVEQKLEESCRTFVSNSCDLGKRFAFITGPNMGGKSTFLRQNAIIAIMAQCGMYVPAEKALLGIVDAVYTRIGASDDLSQDKSTFMIEMLECANILNNATPSSLVIMDEVGRGTSPKEGFAIAKAICKYLHDHTKSRTLFATHYSDLGEVIREMTDTQALMTSADITDKGIVFLHKIIRGVSENSHAIEIARISNMPSKVLCLAQNYLNQE